MVLTKTKKCLHPPQITVHILYHILQEYGIDWDGPVTPDKDTDRVHVPRITPCLSEQQVTELSHAVNPLEECEDLGISLYILTRTFVYACQQV